MIHYHIFSLFPDIFSSFLGETLIKKALESEKIKVDLIDYRDFGIGKHKKVDAPPYGGGAGMVLRPEPIVSALKHEEEKLGTKLHKVLITPQGSPFTQETAARLSQTEKPLGLICGRFEGFDERIRDYVDEEISMGDFILLGGEVAAMAIMEATSRLVPEVLGNFSSVEDESHSGKLLEYAQYTKPFSFEGKEPPAVLLSGNHREVDRWRLENSIERTKKRRPELYKLYKHSQKE